MKTTEERDRMINAWHFKVTDVPLRIRQFLFVDYVFVICPYIIYRDHAPRNNHVRFQFDKGLDKRLEVSVTQIIFVGILCGDENCT